MDECIKCEGPGTELTNKNKCDCKQDISKLSSDNTTCIKCSGPGSMLENDKCVCSEGATPSEDDKCALIIVIPPVPIVQCEDDSIFSGDECIKCKGPGAELSNNNCACKNDISKLSSDETTCIKCSGPRSMLEHDECSCENGFLLHPVLNE